MSFVFMDDEIKLIVQNVSNNESGYKFLKLMLKRLGAFERGVCFDDSRREFYNRGKREQGLWLLDLVRENSFEKYTEIEREAAESGNGTQ